MLLSTPTLLVVILLISAASLASYLLSQWIPLRSSGRTLAWAGLSVGTVLLLAAAAVVALSMRPLSTIHLSQNDGLPQQMIKPAQPSAADYPDSTDEEQLSTVMPGGKPQVQREDRDTVRSTLEAMLSSSLLPPQDRKNKLALLTDLNYAAHDYEATVRSAREYLRYPDSDERMQLILIRALGLTRDYVAAGIAADYLIAQRELAGEAVTAELLKLRADAAAQVEGRRREVAQNSFASSGQAEAASATISLPNETTDHAVAQVASLNSGQSSCQTAAIPDGGNVLGNELWPATNCVRSFHADPADVDRWSIENDCTSPIAIVFAACTESSMRCNDDQSRAWKYQSGGIVLPGKLRRATAEEAPLQFGRQVRYVACAVTSAIPVKLLGLEAAMRSSPSGRLQLDASRDDDECLARVQRWSNAGSRSAMSIDAFLRDGLPQP